MPTLKLNKRAIDSFTYEGDGESRDVRWDTALPGFGLRIYPTGRKAFIVSYRIHGRKRMAVLGNYGARTLDQARDRARRFFVEVREGRDPLAEKQKVAQGQTFGDLIEAYMERHARPHKKTWEADAGRFERHIPPGWRGRKVPSVSREEIAALHHRIGATRPYEANRTLDLLRKAFGLARVWGFLDHAAPNPAEGIQKFKEVKRKRWVTPDELPRLAKAIDEEPSIYSRAALWLYLLTGLRKRELLSARWDDVDWNRGQLRLPITKSGEEQSVVLSGPVLAILQSIPKEEGNPFVFPTGKPKQKPNHHLVNIEKPWRRVRKSAGVEDVRLHDLRRTVGSWMSQAGVDLNLIRDALRHSNIGTTLIYARLGKDAARDAMEDHARRILEAAGRRGPLAVIEGGGGK